MGHDSMILENIPVLTCIGVPDSERASPQKLLVTITLELSLAEVGKTDDISCGLNYDDVRHALFNLATKERKTIECFAEETASILLSSFPSIDHLTVTVTKFPFSDGSSASVTLCRP